MVLVATPSNAMPPGGDAGYITAADGLRLRYARWLRPGGTRGTVCLLHGRTEHIERYREIIEELLQRDFSVVTLDWRSQGLSGRMLPGSNLCHVESFADYDADLDALMAQILPACPRPWTALAHSMGGLILLRAVSSGRARFDRLVLSSPMLQLSPKTAPHPAIVRFLMGSAIFLGRDNMRIPRRFVPQMAATDPVADEARIARRAEYREAEPMLGPGDPTVRWLHAAQLAMQAAAAPPFARGLPQHSLFLIGDRDLVVSAPAIQRMATATASEVVTIQGGRHELMLEPDGLRARFWAAFDAFVR